MRDPWSVLKALFTCDACLLHLEQSPLEAQRSRFSGQLSGVSVRTADDSSGQQAVGSQAGLRCESQIGRL